ncbi:MAG: helix-turn-helix transcriptional regulator [Treponema sp.]|nr:helix-turn-helix transcriptional regulator [Treponema sp.]
MDMMKVFVSNMKKYRKERQLSQMKLAEMLDTSTSYIGEIEINRKIPSMDMVEKIAAALGVEPFRLFIDSKTGAGADTLLKENFLESLTTGQRQDLAKCLIDIISNDIELILVPENKTGRKYQP